MVLNRVNSGNRSIGNGQTTAAGVGFHSKRIQAGLSTQITIQVVAEDGKRYTVGAVQKLDYSQARTLNEYKEVGTDGIIQLAPSSATTHNLTINRMVFDFQRLPQALQREFRHIHAQRRPFDIVVVDYNPYIATPAGVTDTDGAGGGGQATIDTATGSISPISVITTTFKNCWFKSLDISFGADNYQIAENASLQCETVFDNEEVVTLAGPTDALERKTNTSAAASVMSAFDSTRSS